MKRGIKKKLISYLLPITVLVLVPAVIFCFTGIRFNSYSALIVFGGLIALAGLFLFIWTVRLIETKGRGTLAPWAPALTLVTEGPYRYIRNPMISGVLYCLFGMWVIAWNHWLLAWTVFFFIGNTIYFKLSEEPGLAGKFGNEYLEYKKRTPMWIPKFK